MKSLLYSLLVFLFLGLYFNSNGQGNYYEPKARLNFATYLMDIGDYKGCSFELSLYVDSISSLNTRDSIYWLLAKSYFELENYDDGIKSLQKIQINKSFSKYAKLAHSWDMYRNDKHEFFLEPDLYLSTIKKHQSTWTDDLHSLLEAVWLLSYEDKVKYENYFRKTSISNYKVRKSWEEINLIYRTYNDRKRKSPLIAASLATIIPGAGKVYMERWASGLMYFLTCTASALQAYEGYNKGSDIQLYTFSTIFTFVYIGNIYNSILHAKLYNRNAKRKMHNEIRDTIDASFYDLLDTAE